MRLALLVTNTDDSAFALARPLDDAKFAALMAEVRPQWRLSPFWASRGTFPADLSGFDGVMIGGSPASVTEAAPWMQWLEALIRDMVAARRPLFGACFGHQIIARALGVPVIRNPGGWAHGLIEMHRTGRAPWSGPAPTLRLYGSHVEQVARLPDGATGLYESPGCPVAGFAIGGHVFTVQHHPEMTREFISDLVEEYASLVGEAVTRQARASIERVPADRRAFAEEIAAFFENGGC